MKVNAFEMNEMVTETYKPGHEMVRALNLMHDLINEHGLNNDPRFIEANSVLTKSMMEFQTMSYNRGMALCRANAIINKLNEGTVGRQLVKVAKMKLGD